MEPADLLGFQIAVGQLDPHAVQLPVAAVKISVTHGLGHMDRHRLREPFQIHIHALDLINGHDPVFLEDPVGPALHQKLNILFLIQGRIF